jgi:hypothetical protein
MNLRYFEKFYMLTPSLRRLGRNTALRIQLK